MVAPVSPFEQFLKRVGNPNAQGGEQVRTYGGTVAPNIPTSISVPVQGSGMQQIPRFRVSDFRVAGQPASDLDVLRHFNMAMAQPGDERRPLQRIQDMIASGEMAKLRARYDEEMARAPGLFELTNVGTYFPGWDTLNRNNWWFERPEGGDPNTLNLRLKTGEKEGTNIQLRREGEFWVPQQEGMSVGRWDTNKAIRDRNIFLGLMGTVAGAGAAGLFGGGAGAGAGTGAGVTAGGMSVPASLTGGGAMSIPAGTSLLGAGTLAPSTFAPATLGAAGAAGTNLTLGQILSGARQVGSGLRFINELGGGGSTAITAGTETKQTHLTPEAIMEIVRRILEDPQMGVQSIMRPAAAGGGFDSSNQALLMSNLLNRAAATAALAGAPTTTTGRTTGERDQDTFLEELFRRWF